MDYAAINAALYNRVATDTAGSTVRALLGALDTGKAVFQFDKLKTYAGGGAVLPWLVWRPGDATGTSGEMQEIGGSWWAYSSQLLGTKRLFDIRSALETLYGAPGRFGIAAGRVTVTFRGRPFEDATLGNIYGAETRLVYTRR